MTRLENYLEKNCVSVSCAKGTQSKYYRIGAAIIRYSDHVSVDYSGFDIQIIKPVGSFSCLYMFGVSSSSRFSLMNAKQIIAYLPFASMEAELKGAVNYQKPEDVVDIKTNTLVESKLLKDIKFASIVYRLRTTWKENEINMLPSMMVAEFGMGSGINAQFKKFLRTTPIHYQEMLNLYKMLIVDANVVPDKANIGIAFDKVKSLMVK
jgi:hypothetical protein